MKPLQIALLIALGASSPLNSNADSFTPDELGQVTSRIRQESTSDLIEHRSFGFQYRNHRRDPSWPYPLEQSEGWDYGTGVEYHQGQSPSQDYRGLKASGTIGRKFSNRFLTDFTLGFHRLDQQRKPRPDSNDVQRLHQTHQSIPIVLVAASWVPTDPLDIRGEYERDWIYQELVQPSQGAAGLHAHTGRAALTLRPFRPVRTQIKGSHRLLSDSNQKSSVEGSALYGVSTGIPWVWAGVGFESSRFGESNPAYWSPKRLFGWGPRIEASLGLFQKLNGSASMSYGFTRDSVGGSSRGLYSNLTLSYGGREELQVGLNYVAQRTGPFLDRWSSDAVALALGAPL